MIERVKKGYRTLREISELGGIPRSTTHRVLANLLEEHVLRHDARGYPLEVRLIEFGEHAKRGFSLEGAAKAPMVAMVNRSTETVHLGILNGNDIVYLRKVEDARRLQMKSHVGLRARP